LLDESMDHIEAQGRAPTTVARYRSAVSANIKPHLGSKSINKLGRRISTASTVSWPRQCWAGSASARATPSLDGEDIAGSYRLNQPAVTSTKRFDISWFRWFYPGPGTAPCAWVWTWSKSGDL
jgi:hypothetical protein